MTQPHPDVTAADIERLVRRDFAPEHVDHVLSVLDEYGTEDWHREPERVRAAVLKLAAGSLEQLRMHIAAAKMDFRDVLSDAEYPLYTKRWFHIDKLSEDERQRIIDSDWKQYQDWFNRP